MPRDPGEKFGNSFGLDEDHSREPRRAAPAGRPRPPTRAIRGQHRPFSIFPLRPPLNTGASAHLTPRTLTQADATRIVNGARTPGTGRRATARDRGADQVRRHPPWPAIPDTAATPTAPEWTTGRTAARCGTSFPAVTRDPAQRAPCGRWHRVSR